MPIIFMVAMLKVARPMCDVDPARPMRDSDPPRSMCDVDPARPMCDVEPARPMCDADPAISMCDVDPARPMCDAEPVPERACGKRLRQWFPHHSSSLYLVVLITFTISTPAVTATVFTNCSQFDTNLNLVTLEPNTNHYASSLRHVSHSRCLRSLVLFNANMIVPMCYSIEFYSHKFHAPASRKHAFSISRKRDKNKLKGQDKSNGVEL
ncbi:hypothetical protein RRG08_059613 [Elysia crispata]|uniref:Uncharacterized protein n=1 Tax=Elysia crispata TaxID=231223 RepID=A0AAE1CVS6_9GAST|nr:hypothetical protein RRG08_059613 [Elysia crispata]